MVTVADERRIPSAKFLLDSDLRVVVREVLSENTVISVYENGYVLYQVAGYATVFPLHPCKDYSYDSLNGEPSLIRVELFDREAWYVRLMIEGEDRIMKNQDERVQKHSISYSAIAEDWNVLQFEENGYDQIENQDLIEQTLYFLENNTTENQRMVLQMHFYEGMSCREIAKKLGVTHQAVSSSVRRFAEAVRKEIL